MSPLSMEMKVSKSSGTWQGHEEVDLIAPCKEKIQQLLSCCQDVAQVVESLEARMMQSSTTQTAPVMLEVDNTKIEICLLRDELRRSKLHNEELEAAKMSMEKKIAGMEEKIQALTAQLMVYKEDFDLERRDRECAQGRLIEFEQQLLYYQRPHESYPSRSMLEPCGANSRSSRSRQQIHHHHADELIPRGRDVCDNYETDGVEEGDTKISEKPAMPYTATDAADEPHLPLNRDTCSSLELRAQSFNILDFFPAAEKTINAIAAKPRDAGHKMVIEDGWNAAERDTLCADGVELPRPLNGAFTSGTSVASPPSRRPVHQHKPQQESYRPISWLSLSEDHGETNLYQTDSSRLVPEASLEESQLMCPKCHMRFSCSDHLRLLDHLEEC